jgi:hypothetical protein
LGLGGGDGEREEARFFRVRREDSRVAMEAARLALDWRARAEEEGASEGRAKRGRDGR